MKGRCSIIGCQEEYAIACDWCEASFCDKHPGESNICRDTVERQRKEAAAKRVRK